MAVIVLHVIRNLSHKPYVAASPAHIKGAGLRDFICSSLIHLVGLNENLIALSSIVNPKLKAISFSGKPIAIYRV